MAKHWTLGAAMEHILALMDTRFTAQERAVAAALAAQEKAVAAALAAAKEAVLKAEESTNQRLALLNELRGMITDRDAQFATSEALGAQSDKLGALGDRMNSLEGRTLGARNTLGFLAAGASLLIAVAAIVFR